MGFRETLEGWFFRLIFLVIVGIGLLWLGTYAGTKLTGWKQNVSVMLAILGAFLLAGALMKAVDLLRSIHSW